MEHGQVEDNKLKEKEITVRLDKRCEQEKMLCKSWITWLKEGERNTDLFCFFVVQHRSNKCISKIKMEEGMILEAHEEMEQELIHYFQDLLTETIPSQAQAIAQVT